MIHQIWDKNWTHTTYRTMGNEVKDGQLNPIFLSNVQNMGLVPYSIKVETNSGHTYIGKTGVGLSDKTDLPIWQIMKVEVSGFNTTIKYADGNLNFDNVFEDYLTLDYV